MAAMDDVPREILQAAYKRSSIYLLKIPFAFAVWAACTVALYKMEGTPYAIPFGIACSILIANLIRGLGAIAHDAVHGSAAKGKLANYLVSLVCWSPTGMSVTIYGNYHLHHHKIANTYPDVDNFVVSDYTRNPFLARLLVFVVYLFAYPIYFMFCMFRYTKRLSLWKKIRMNLELGMIFGLAYLAYRFMPHYVFFYFYGLPFILGAFLASMTSMIEHFQMEPGEDAYGSRTYGTKAHAMNFIWNNVTYHTEHHKFPGIPWYNLKSFHQAAYPYYDEKVKAECHPSIFGIAFRLYGKIWQLDVEKMAAKYAHLNKAEEKQKMMAMAGIPSGAA